jgi:hypothetical protein
MECRVIVISPSLSKAERAGEFDHEPKNIFIAPLYAELLSPTRHGRIALK